MSLFEQLKAEARERIKDLKDTKFPVCRMPALSETAKRPAVSRSALYALLDGKPVTPRVVAGALLVAMTAEQNGLVPKKPMPTTIPDHGATRLNP